MFPELKIVMETCKGATGPDVPAVPPVELWVLGKQHPALPHADSRAVGSLLYLPWRLAAGLQQERPELEAGHLGRRPKVHVPLLASGPRGRKGM